jgi:hypothetical protein
MEVISVDVLALILQWLNTKIERRAFVNFWIACLGCNVMKGPIHNALLTIDVPYYLEKTIRTRLSPYLTSLYKYSKWEYTCFIAQEQMACCRLRKAYMSGSAINLDQAEKLQALEKISLYSATVDTSFLMKMPKLNNLSFHGTTICNSANVHNLINITRLSLDRIKFTTLFCDSDGKSDVLVLFPNLVALELEIICDQKHEHYLLNLSEFQFLENLRVLVTDHCEEHSPFRTTIDVVVTGTNLKNIELSPNAKLICEAYPNLTHLTISDGYTNFYYSHNRVDIAYAGPIRLEDIFTRSPNLKHLSLSTHIDPILPFFEYTPQITHLSINGYRHRRGYGYENREISAAISQAEFKLAISRLPNLQHLELRNLSVNESHIPALNEWCRQLSHLTWCYVTNYIANNNNKGFAPNKSAISKLKSLKAVLDSSDWILIYPEVAKISHTELTMGKIKDLCQE